MRGKRLYFIPCKVKPATWRRLTRLSVALGRMKSTSLILELYTLVTSSLPPYKAVSSNHAFRDVSENQHSCQISSRIPETATLCPPLWLVVIKNLKTQIYDIIFPGLVWLFVLATGPHVCFKMRRLSRGRFAERTRRDPRAHQSRLKEPR